MTPPEQSMEERFDENVWQWFKYGIVKDKVDMVALKAFITAECAKAEERGYENENATRVKYNADAQEEGATRERHRIVAIMEDMKPILWNDDLEKHSRNVDKYNLLDALLRSIQEHKE